ncbi:hypothetical protein M378DRAFT_182113, partial [Amanita muscaria Koide BX008]
MEGRIDGPKAGKVPEDPERGYDKVSENNKEKRDDKNAPKGGYHPGEKKYPRSKLSREERDRLRAEQRCFTCKEVGHESRNCPRRRQAKAPVILTGAVNIAEVEANGARAREVDLSLGSMSLRHSDAEIGDLSPSPPYTPSDLESLLREEWDDYFDRAVDNTVMEGGSNRPINEDNGIREYLRLAFCEYFGVDHDSQRFTVTELDSFPYLQYEVTDRENPSDSGYLVSSEEFELEQFSVEW